VLAEIVAKLDALSETKRAAEAGIERETILALAQRLKPDEVIDLDQAVKELTAAVETAITVSQQGTRDSNLGDLVDTVLARIADKTRAGDIDGAASEADRGFAEWERSEAERRADSVRSGIALLQAGLEQDILRRDARAAARRVERMVALEHPDAASARFAAMHWASARAAPPGSSRRSRPFGRRSPNGPASACRSTGP
jgi:acyl-CoA reductase-like NAD-dependent aldehyde dehydrogenase